MKVIPLVQISKYSYQSTWAANLQRNNLQWLLNENFPLLIVETFFSLNLTNWLDKTKCLNKNCKISRSIYGLSWAGRGQVYWLDSNGVSSNLAIPTNRFNVFTGVFSLQLQPTVSVYCILACWSTQLCLHSNDHRINSYKH